MAAEKGNKYAEKWTREMALELANKAFNSVNDDCFYISEVAEACETYREFFFYILRKFNDDEEVFNTIKRMQNKCESIVAKKTGKNEIAQALGIFILKSYHGLTETSNLNIGSNPENPLKIKIGDSEFEV